jgi:polyhydroxybutyrate depolymerase
MSRNLSFVGTLLVLGLCSRLEAASVEIHVDPTYPTVTVSSAASYDQDPTPVPLVLLLHGYGQSASNIDSEWNLSAQQNSYNFIYAFPEGRTNFLGDVYWDGSDSCCVLPPDHYTDDDVIYLSQLIEAIKNEFMIDERRVYILGWSNGGSMAVRMACERADLVTSVVNMGGPGIFDETTCTPSEPVDVLAIFGQNDPRIVGGTNAGTGLPFPSVAETLQDWAGYNDCSGAAVYAGATPLDTAAGDGNTADTTRQIFATDCRSFRGQNEYWLVANQPHSVAPFTNKFARNVLNWLYANDTSSLRFADPTTLEWGAVDGASEYNVYVGADPTVGLGACANASDSDLTDTEFPATDEPAPGELLTYLVTYEDLQTGSETGEGAGGHSRPAPPPCP